MTKAMGFNMIRKHVKVEPARWYTWCDRLGMLVWQDIVGGFPRPTGGPGHVPHDAESEWDRPADSARLFEQEMKEMVRNFEFFPSIVCWVVFNEGWGQFDTERTVRLAERLDPARIINPVSGWLDRPVGHLNDAHQYPGPGMEPPAAHPQRAIVLGEFGGLGLPLKDHLWEVDRTWGYQSFGNPEDLQQLYADLIANLIPMIDRGLAAAVYTQTTDVESETNGLMTYDRAIVKMDPQWLRELHAELYQPSGEIRWYAPTGELDRQQWMLTTENPGARWTTRQFDDAGWSPAQTPVATPGMPHIPVGTAWERGPLWLRRTFTVEDAPLPGLSLSFYTSDEVEVYLNGEKVFERPRDQRIGFRHYTDIDLGEHADLLRSGENVQAVHAKPVGPRHSVDAGLYGHSRPAAGPTSASGE